MPTAAELQTDLEAEDVYGPGNVEVTSTTEATGTSFKITSIGKDLDSPVPALELPIVVGSVTTKVLSAGQPDGEIVVTAANLGDATVNGEKHPVTLTDVLPAGLKAVSVSASVPLEDNASSVHFVPLACSLESSSRVACVVEGKAYNNDGEPVTNAKGEILPKTVPAFDQIRMHVGVLVEAQAPASSVAQTAANEVSISGGGAPAASLSRPVKLSRLPVPFGVENYQMANEEPAGTPDQRAGSHPFQTTFTTVLDTSSVTYTEKFGAEPQVPALAKDLTYQAPPGWVGDPSAFEHCTTAQFYLYTCPAGSVVGVTSTTVNEPGTLGLSDIVVPLYNLEPEPGQAARFGFFPTGQPVFIDATVRSGADYGVTAHVENITQIAGFLANETTIWGVPGLAAHDDQRGLGCLEEAEGVAEGGVGVLEKVISCHPLEQPHPPAFLSLPTACPPAPQSTLAADSWAEPQPANPEQGALFATSSLPALDGCNKLPFTPSIEVSPDVKEASKPSGLKVDVHVPQSETLNAAGLAEADPRTITVALPAGVSVNPSSAGGLQACSEGLVGFENIEELSSQPGQTAIFSSYLPGSIAALAAGDSEELRPGSNFCPNASKLGTVEIKTPLLPNPIKGFVYLAAQEQNPFGSLLAMYIVAEENGKEDEQGSGSGVLVRLAGEVSLCKHAGEVLDGLSCEAPGQIVTEFANSPQAPFEDAILHFFGGERAPLSTPTRCGTYTTRAALTPWTGNTPVFAASHFNIESGPGGGPCPGASLPFAPTLTGGAQNVNAGAFSPFTLTMSRLPGEQNLQSVQAILPPGLSGVLSNVELCPEPQANEGTCSESSKIGETTVSVGVGGEPFAVSGGKFYVTGPYNGAGACKVSEPGCAPFGITFEVPAKAGPFDLAKTQSNHPACDCVLVRGKIEINPYTAALTITSNPAGVGGRENQSSDAIPTELEGIPLEIQHVNAITTRNDFQFNPTNCNKMEVTGTIHSSEGGTDRIGVPFQVTNCKNLDFTPKFTVSVSGKTSKANGTSLTTSVTEPAGSLTTQANLAKVKVELPVQLPSRLTTLQKACTSKQFELNPAACPSESKIGYAKVHTPLLPVPLEGPAIFVSHGGEAFPSLTMVLQGDGVTIDLVGSTYISPKGITSTTFKTVPDQPFNTFELTLHNGPYSALTANTNLCAPTTTKTVTKRVKVKVHGRKKTVTRKVKEQVPATLQMPTEFVAQNGAEIHQTTPITVTGCGKTVKKSTKKHKHKKSAHTNRRTNNDHL